MTDNLIPHYFHPEDNQLDYIYGPLPRDVPVTLADLARWDNMYANDGTTSEYKGKTIIFNDQLLLDRIKMCETSLVQLRTLQAMRATQAERPKQSWWHRVFRALATHEDLANGPSRPYEGN